MACVSHAERSQAAPAAHCRGPSAGTGYRYDEDEDTADENALSPPPSSSVSSLPDDLADEIVVGTDTQATVNGDRPSPLRVTPGKEDATLVNAYDEASAAVYPKRKRASVYEHLGEDKLEMSLRPGAEDDGAGGCLLSKQARSTTPAMKGVLLGHWRDSPVPKDAKKHAVVGFPDVRNRLRTRIELFTCSGETVNARLFPIPPGTGGRWTTFDRIVFSDHLVGLDHNEIKEYIKLRLKTGEREKSAEERHQAELATIEEVKRYLKINPPPKTLQPPAVAYGKELPDNPQHRGRADNKRRRTSSTTIHRNSVISQPMVDAIQQEQPPPPPPPPAHTPRPELQPEPRPQPHAQEQFQSQSQSQSQSQAPAHMQPQVYLLSQNPSTPNSGTVSIPTPPQRPQNLQQQLGRSDDAQYIGDLPGQRPTRILVGCWSRSNAMEDVDKHAIYGILGANDMFRVKLVRETIDGRFVNGNFPTGAGALWIAYGEVNFLPHVRALSRTEMKEYVRVRQYQIDSGETEEERVTNETMAVYEAQSRAALNPKTPAGPYSEDMVSPQIQPELSMPDGKNPRSCGKSQDIRGRPVPEADYRAVGASVSIDSLERIHGLARREVHKMEAAQMRQDRVHSQRSMCSSPLPTSPPGIVPSDNRAMLQDNMHRLTKVWNSQEAARRQGQQQLQPQTQAQHQQEQSHQVQGQAQAQILQIAPQQPQQQKQQQPPPLPSQQQQMLSSPNMEELRVLGNVTYNRKQTGPFAGKLVSRGEIITIDGEDYVEYRVLTKPTFF